MQSDVKTKKAGNYRDKKKQETSTANDKAKPKNDQSSEPKSKLPKLNFQGYVLFALPKIKETKSFYHWLHKLQYFNTSSIWRLYVQYTLEHCICW